MLVIITFLFIFISFDIQAQNCPDGWNSNIITNTFHLPNGNDCEGYIMYCWRDYNGNREIFVTAVGFLDKTCLYGTDINNPYFWELCDITILNYEANLPNSNNEHLSVSPCSEKTFIVSVDKKSCWKYINNANNSVDFVQCENIQGNCLKEYSLCWDYSSQIPALIITNVQLPPVCVLCETGYIYNPEIPESPCFSNCSN